MKEEKPSGRNTVCTHVGEVPDPVYKGAVSPLYASTSYAYEGVDIKRYPRYFNTPNQEGVSMKIAALEYAETAMVFSSGMAAISTALMSFLKKGDHVIFPNSLYGGTYHFAKAQLPRQGIEYDFVNALNPVAVASAIRPETKVIYLETPSNPTLEITDLRALARIAKERGLLTVIDNTFASPIHQNPILLGIDIVVHSATKYMGGHSDLCAGAVATRHELMEQVWETAICFGGNLSDYSVWMLERSLKTLKLRVDQQSRNAMELARYLEGKDWVDRVYYPGLESFPQHSLAADQMSGFGGMLSFALTSFADPTAFLGALSLIKPTMSLAGVESTALQPSKTSHALMPESEREALGITDQLVRFSCGIEDIADIIADLEQAVDQAVKQLP